MTLSPHDVDTPMSLRTNPSADVDESTTDLQRLRAEVAGDDSDDTGPVQSADESLDAVLEAFLEEESFEFTEETVKGDLGEILLALVAGRSSETNGKRLMEDLSRVFDAELSPGTVYPKLHDFEEAGLLERHELVRTKEYQLDDPDACRERITGEMRQHLVLGLFYRRMLDEI
jgi:hypothetical protein